MRKILVFLMCVSCLFATGMDDYYKQGNIAEQKGDYKEAMRLYKEGLKLALENKPKKNSLVTNAELTKKQRDPADIDPILLKKANAYSYMGSDSEVSNFENDTKLSNLGGGDLFGLEVYKPTYFIYAYDFDKKRDRNQKELKFQFSLQMPLLENVFGLNEKLALAYTQTSWWQIWEESAPFRETNYAPELYLKIPTSNSAIFNYYKFGLLHESNGESGLSSRSWNRAYLQSSLNFYGFEIVPRVWYGFGYDDTNKNIDDYLGYGDINVNFNYGRQKFNAMFRNNLKFDGNNRGAVELNYNFPIYKGLYGYIQYFNGYGESLIDYDRKVNKLGVGFSILE